MQLLYPILRGAACNQNDSLAAEKEKGCNVILGGAEKGRAQSQDIHIYSPPLRFGCNVL